MYLQGIVSKVAREYLCMLGRTLHPVILTTVFPMNFRHHQEQEVLLNNIGVRAPSDLGGAVTFLPEKKREMPERVGG